LDAKNPLLLDLGRHMSDVISSIDQKNAVGVENNQDKASLSLDILGKFVHRINQHRAALNKKGKDCVVLTL
jgi:hypothetical protein